MRNFTKNLKFYLFLIGIGAIAFFFFSMSYTENYSNGDKIGTITSFQKQGRFFKSYEGHLNVTQTGMNSGIGFDFSIDRDENQPDIIALLDTAQNNGWKVKIVFHEVMGWNFWKNRGHTNFFVTKVIVLDKNFDKPFAQSQSNVSQPANNAPNTSNGSVRDTIYIVIVPSDINYAKFFKSKHDTIKGSGIRSIF